VKRGENRGKVLIYNLTNTSPPIFHWAQAAPPGIGIEATANCKTFRLAKRQTYSQKQQRYRDREKSETKPHSGTTCSALFPQNCLKK